LELLQAGNVILPDAGMLWMTKHQHAASPSSQRELQLLPLER